MKSLVAVAVLYGCLAVAVGGAHSQAFETNPEPVDKSARQGLEVGMMGVDVTLALMSLSQDRWASIVQSLSISAGVASMALATSEETEYGNALYLSGAAAVAAGVFSLLRPGDNSAPRVSVGPAGKHRQLAILLRF